uniref:Putative secreted protein n=1 Tax=Anopheles darlingi TaxID=43151 RepID=A0A2M4DJR7_ANODA
MWSCIFYSLHLSLLMCLVSASKWGAGITLCTVHNFIILQPSKPSLQRRAVPEQSQLPSTLLLLGCLRFECVVHR